jgi:hypothetical protein
MVGKLKRFTARLARPCPGIGFARSKWRLGQVAERRLTSGEGSAWSMNAEQNEATGTAPIFLAAVLRTANCLERCPGAPGMKKRRYVRPGWSKQHGFVSEGHCLASSGYRKEALNERPGDSSRTQHSSIRYAISYVKDAVEMSRSAPAGGRLPGSWSANLPWSKPTKSQKRRMSCGCAAATWGLNCSRQPWLKQSSTSLPGSANLRSQCT